MLSIVRNMTQGKKMTYQLRKDLSVSYSHTQHNRTHQGTVNIDFQFAVQTHYCMFLAGMGTAWQTMYWTDSSIL